MAFPFVPVFLGLLLAYMVYSEWAGLDSRYLVAGALVLLIATAVVDAAGATTAANTLAEFVFFLLGGGVVLLLVDHLRDARRAPRPDSAARPGNSDPPDRSETGERPPEEPLDRAQEETVALVDAPGH